jgi:asparaginyl-tRNA synthetase
LERDTSALEPAAAGDYPRISYDRALDLLAEAGEPLAWGEDFGAPHETLLGKRFDRPLVIERYPTGIKAFYMQPVPDDASRVLCNDVLAPEGYGEIIGGSQRIHDLALLEARIAEHGLPRRRSSGTSTCGATAACRTPASGSGSSGRWRGSRARTTCAR